MLPYFTPSHFCPRHLSSPLILLSLLHLCPLLPLSSPLTPSPPSPPPAHSAPSISAPHSAPLTPTSSSLLSAPPPPLPTQCQYSHPAETLSDLQQVQSKFSDLRLYVDFYCEYNNFLMSHFLYVFHNKSMKK